MATTNFVSVGSFAVFVPFITLIFTTASLIILLDCIWRVEYRLNTAFKLLAVSLVIVLIRRASGFLGLDQSPDWVNILAVFDFCASLFSLLGFIEFVRIVRSLTRENQKKV